MADFTPEEIAEFALIPDPDALGLIPEFSPPEDEDSTDGNR